MKINAITQTLTQGLSTCFWTLLPIGYWAYLMLRRHLATLAILSSSLLFLLPSEYFLLNLLQSFTFQAMLGYAFLALLLWLAKLRTPAYAAVVAFSALLAFLLPYFGSGRAEITEKVDLKVAHFNVLMKNEDYDKTLAKALNSGADFISFQEVSSGWADVLPEELSKAYPYYRIQEHPESSYGIAVFSKYPLKNVRVPRWTGIPNITGDILLADSTVHFVAAHTRSPTRYWRYKGRNEHLQEITRYITGKEGPLIALGDFNIVPWATQLKELKEDTGMQDSRKALVPTFPAWLPIAQLPIDYIFHSKEIKCTGFDAVEGTSSDHLGIVGTYRIL